MCVYLEVSVYNAFQMAVVHGKHYLIKFLLGILLSHFPVR